jgi:two-component system, OmpR family, response regulator QseB
MIPGVRRGATASEVRRAPDAAPEPVALFVDPDVASAERLAGTLRAYWATKVVASAHEARAVLRVTQPWLVVTELDLPDMPGLDLLVALHDHPLTRHVMLMIVTTRRTISDKIAGFQAGADDYLVKPVDRELFALHVELLSRLRRRL